MTNGDFKGPLSFCINSIFACNQQIRMNTLVVILGPTGVGKSDISVQLAKHYQSEILSADSRQFYKEMSIGTAVPDQVDLNTVPHHFIQNISIHDYYNVSSFETEAIELLDCLFKRCNPVILTGGSMLYLDTLCHGIDDIPTVDQDTRNEVIAWFEQNGLEALREDRKSVV